MGEVQDHRTNPLPSTAVHEPRYGMSGRVAILEGVPNTEFGCYVNTVAWLGTLPVSQAPSSPYMASSFLGKS